MEEKYWALMDFQKLLRKEIGYMQTRDCVLSDYITHMKACNTKLNCSICATYEQRLTSAATFHKPAKCPNCNKSI